jgi:hypothetical protein
MRDAVPYQPASLSSSENATILKAESELTPTKIDANSAADNENTPNTFYKWRNFTFCSELCINAAHTIDHFA